MENCTKCGKTKLRSEEDKKKLLNRLNRINGQINGIKKMIEEDRYCDDVLIQLAAASKAIKSLSTVILKEHLSTCVIQSIKENDLTVIDEIVDLFKRYE